MISSPLPNRFPAPRPTINENPAKKAAHLESLARVIEGAIPSFKQSEERQFYREVVQSYRAAARNLLWKSWLDS